MWMLYSLFVYQCIFFVVYTQDQNLWLPQEPEINAAQPQESYNYKGRASNTPGRLPSQNSPWNVPPRTQLDDEDQKNNFYRKNVPPVGGGNPPSSPWGPYGNKNQQLPKQSSQRKPSPQQQQQGSLNKNDMEGSGGGRPSVEDPLQPLPPNNNPWGTDNNQFNQRLNKLPLMTTVPAPPPPPVNVPVPSKPPPLGQYPKMVDTEGSGLGGGSNISPPPPQPPKSPENNPWSPNNVPNQGPNTRPVIPLAVPTVAPVKPPGLPIQPPRVPDEEGSGLPLPSAPAFKPPISTKQPSTAAPTRPPLQPPLVPLPEGSGQSPLDEEKGVTYQPPGWMVSESKRQSTSAPFIPPLVVDQSVSSTTTPITTTRAQDTSTTLKATTVTHSSTTVSTTISSTTARPLYSTTTLVWPTENDVWIEVQFNNLYYPEYAENITGNEKLTNLQEEIRTNILNSLFSLPGTRRVEFFGISPGPVKLLCKLMTLERNQVTFIYVHILRNAANLNRLSNHTIRAVNELKREEVCISPEIRCTTSRVCVRGSYCDGKSDCPGSGEDEPADSCMPCNDAVELKMLNPSVELGRSLHLKCDGVSRCSPVRWYHNGRALMQFNGKLELRLPLLQSSDTGKYECWAGNQKAIIDIDPMAKPSIRFNPDRDTLKLVRTQGSERVLPLEQRTPSGEVVCSASRGSVRWLPPHSNWPTGVQTVRVSDTEVKLVFMMAAEELAGNYTCEVRWGTNLTMEAVKRLQVFGPCTAGAELQCPNAGVCYPTAGKCDGQPNCPDLSDEIGCPRCIGETLHVTNPILNVNEGSSHHISCLGPPQCYPVMWRRSDSRPIEGTRITMTGGTLFINHVTKEDEGIYECLSGNQSAQFKLIVHTKPEIMLSPSEPHYNLSFGQSLRILCNSSSQYSHWRYLGNSQEEWPQSVERRNVGSTGRELIISKAVPSIAGVYQCEVIWGSQFNARVSSNVSIAVASIQCNATAQWKCKDGLQCIALLDWCNGQPQCQDRSDEVDCPKCHYGTLEVRPQALHLFKGKTGQLACQAPPQCQPVSWQRADGRALSNRVTVYNDKLFLAGVQVPDGGVYQCLSGSKVASANVTVSEEIHIQLVDTADFLLFPYGAEQRALCQVLGGQYEPEWVREDGKPLTVGGNVRSVALGSGRAQLHFISPTFEASGVYKCVVPSNPQSGVRLMVYVQSVTCDARSERRCSDGKKCVPNTMVCDGKFDCLDGSDEQKCSQCRGQLYITPAVHTTVSDTLVVFRCQIPNSDCLPVVWERQDGRPIPTDRWIAPGNTLVIISSRHEDSGVVVCRHANVKATARLNVMGLNLRLNITGDTLRIPRGGSGAVSCQSNMEQPVWIAPENQHVWLYGVRYDYPARGRMDIRFINVQPKAAGVYQCVVRTSQGQTKKIQLRVIVN